LTTLHLFDHLARSLSTSEKFERRNVTSSVRRRFAQRDLVRLLRFLRTFSTGNTTPATPGEFLNPDDLGDAQATEI
jgi:hypothetical protein